MPVCEYCHTNETNTLTEAHVFSHKFTGYVCAGCKGKHSSVEIISKIWMDRFSALGLQPTETKLERKLIDEKVGTHEKYHKALREKNGNGA